MTWRAARLAVSASDACFCASAWETRAIRFGEGKSEREHKGESERARERKRGRQSKKERETDGQAGRQKQTDRQAGRLTHRQAGLYTER